MSNEILESGTRVRWRFPIRGAREKFGTIARAVPPGEVPEGFRGFGRNVISYIVRTDSTRSNNGRAYWVRAALLARDDTIVTVALSPEDRKQLDWLAGEIGGCGCDHVIPLLERLAAGR